MVSGQVRAAGAGCCLCVGGVVNAETINLLIAAANTLTWPGAFAIVGVAACAAAGFAVVVWALTK